jgi:Methyltransferase domain
MDDLRRDEIEDIFRGVSLGADGIYRAQAPSEASYHDSDHDACLQVEDASFWFRHRNECISAAMGRAKPRGLFLDVGGGNGYVAKRIEEDGIRTALLEPGELGARNAKHVRGLSTVVCVNLGDAGLRHESVGAVGAFDVVEHIKDDSSFVDAIADALPANGMFFSTVPSHSWLWSEADVDAGHFRRYSRESYSALLSARFEITYATHFFAPLVAPLFLLRSLPHRIGLSRRSLRLSDASEHGTSGGFAAKAISAMLDREVENVRSGRSMRLGTSLLVTARKR